MDDSFASSLDDFLNLSETAETAEELFTQLDRVKDLLPMSDDDFEDYVSDALKEEIVNRTSMFSLILMQLVANLKAEADLNEEGARLLQIVEASEEKFEHPAQDLVDRMGEDLVDQAVHAAKERMIRYAQTIEILTTSRDIVVNFLTEEMTKFADYLEANL